MKKTKPIDFNMLCSVILIATGYVIVMVGTVIKYPCNCGSSFVNCLCILPLIPLIIGSVSIMLGLNNLIMLSKSLFGA